MRPSHSSQTGPGDSRHADEHLTGEMHVDDEYEHVEEISEEDFDECADNWRADETVEEDFGGEDGFMERDGEDGAYRCAEDDDPQDALSQQEVRF